jgi:hypothetical protein
MKTTTVDSSRLLLGAKTKKNVLESSSHRLASRFHRLGATEWYSERMLRVEAYNPSPGTDPRRVETRTV